MRSSHKPWVYLVATVVISGGFAVNASAGTTAGSAPVSEQNLDANHFIRTHEQGTALANIVNFPLDGLGNLKTSGSSTVGGTVNIGNTPNVNALQSGLWNVGQSGLWNVGQSGSWNVGQSGPWNVGQQGPWTVGLDPAASQLLTDIRAKLANFKFDNLGNLQVAPLTAQTATLAPFTCIGGATIANSSDSASASCLPAPPAGKIFVIEDVSAFVSFAQSEPNRAEEVSFDTVVNNNGGRLEIPMPTVDQENASGGRSARGYEAGGGLSAGTCHFFFGLTAPHGGTASCAAAGYLVNAS